MAKKTKNEVPARSIDYIQIVDEMTNEAFAFCVENLYPLFNYSVLQQEDVRRVDLKEKLVGLEKQIPSGIVEGRADLKGIRNFYLFMLRLFFEQFLKYETGSRVHRFKNRAYEAMSRALSDKGSIQDIDDTFLVFISLFPDLPDYAKTARTRITKEVSFGACMADAEWIKQIWESKEFIPDGIVEKKGILDKMFGVDYEIRTAMKLMYMNNIIFLARALQNYGAYSQEDE